MARPKLADSINYAMEGLIYVLKSQRNMRLHFLFSTLLLLLGIYLNLGKFELLMLLTAIVFVLFAEMFNTAIEYTVDLVSNTINPLARIIKDVGAGAVLLASLNALIVFYVVFSRHFDIPFENVLTRIEASPWHITFISLIVVLSLVVAGKVFLNSGTPMRGGMPSGHAALAFCIWTILLFATANNLVIILTFILALLVARSRLVSAVHNIWEVLAGSVLGVLTTTLIFQIIKYKS